MYFLLYLPLHKRQALSPIEENRRGLKRNPPRTKNKRLP